MKYQKLINSEGTQLLPITHEKLVVDNDGVRASTKFKHGVFIGDLRDDQIPDSDETISVPGNVTEIDDTAVSSDTTWSSEKISGIVGSGTHASNHAIGGSDPITPASIGAEASGAAATVQNNLNLHKSANNPHGITPEMINADDRGAAEAVQTNLSNHMSANNPHGITAESINADAKGAAATVQNNLTNHLNASNPHGITAAGIGALAKITGSKGQVIGFDDDGEPVAQEAASASSSTSATLLVNSWVMGDDGRYYQTVSVPSVTADTKVIIVDVDLSTDDADAKVAYLEAWAHPSANEVKQGNGTLTFYAWEQPTANIPINVGVM